MTLRLNGSTSGYVEIDAPATAGSNTLVLPTGNGTNGQYLQTNGSGALSWATLPASGKILQVVSDTNGTATETMGGSFTKVTGLEVTLTPASTSSRFVILITAYTDGSGTSYGPLQIRRNTSVDVGTEHYYARPVSSGCQTSYFAVDAPATTSNVTYNLYGRTDSGSVVIGRCTMIVYEVSS